VHLLLILLPTPEHLPPTTIPTLGRDEERREKESRKKSTAEQRCTR
jgi:hypothetical protein